MPKRSSSWGGRREGAGRRRVGALPRLSVAFSLPGELVEQLDGLAAARGKTRSAIVREALAAYLLTTQGVQPPARAGASARRAGVARRRARRTRASG